MRIIEPFVMGIEAGFLKTGRLNVLLYNQDHLFLL